MFMNKYQATSAVNEVADLAKKLGVEFRSSPRGISILSGKPKFFGLDELEKAKRLIKQRANPELQTTLVVKNSICSF